MVTFPIFSYQAAGDGGWNFMLIALVWFVAALVLYFTRPASLRRRNDMEKPPPGSDGDRVKGQGIDTLRWS